MSPSDAAWRLVKDYYFHEAEDYDDEGNPLQTTKTGRVVPLARGIGSPRMQPKYNLAHPKNVALGEMGADDFTQFLGPAVAHEETHRAMEPDIRAAKDELPDTMSEAEKRAWYMRAHEIGAYQGQFPGGQEAHEEAEATALGQRDSPRHPFIDESITNFPKPILRSEPMVIAMQLLKEVGRAESSPTLMGNPKATAYISQNKDPAKLPCSVCDGKILQQPCRKCGRPASLGADVLTGEPMDIVMQLLKYQTRLPLDPHPERPTASIRRRQERGRRAKGGQPARLHVARDRFSLLDYDDNVLSQLENEGDEVGANTIEGHYGFTPDKNRNRGYYQDLLEAALRHGYGVVSDQRNFQSHPFHKKFLTNLPPDIEAEGAHGIDTDSDFISNLNERDGIYYSGKYSPGNAIGWGDLQTDSRSKVPMTYETDYQRYQDRLNRGVHANTDIQVREADGQGKNYVQSRLDLDGGRFKGMGPLERSHEYNQIQPTNQGIGVPRGISITQPFHQIDRPLHDINFAPSLQAGAVGIDPRRLTRNQLIQQQS